MRALVTTPSSPVSLFFVRRLKQMGYTVTAIDSHRRSFASYSNAVSKTIIAPSLRYDPLVLPRLFWTNLSERLRLLPPYSSAAS